jgi:hypothetical protein
MTAALGNIPSPAGHEHQGNPAAGRGDWRAALIAKPRPWPVPPGNRRGKAINLGDSGLLVAYDRRGFDTTKTQSGSRAAEFAVTHNTAII